MSRLKPHVLTALLLPAALVAAGACGTLAVPFSLTNRSETPENRGAAGETPAEPPLTIAPIEGQPRGLMLRLSASTDLSPEGVLVVERRIGEADPETARTIELNTKRIDRLRRKDEGLQFLDRAVVEGKRHRYRVVYHPPARRDAASDGPDGPGAARSPTTEFTWAAPPDRPERPEVLQTGGLVELQWEPHRGAVVFRRNVLKDGAETRRLATVGQGARGGFVDRSARPGGVYAYRVALARDDGGFPQFGHPSEPVYVSLE